MINVSKSLTVSFNSQQMFNLVNDVKSYKSFVPLCVASDVLQETSSGMLASLSFKYGLIHCSFTTNNSMISNEEIKMQLASGPFKKLSGYWQFIPQQNGGCTVKLQVSFLSNNRILQMALTKSLDAAINKVMQAFMGRAEQIYNGSHNL